jgi:hypothetical protein
MPFYAKHTLFSNDVIQCAFENSSYFSDSVNSYSYLNTTELSKITSANSGCTVTGINNYYIGSSSSKIYAAASVKNTLINKTTQAITYAISGWETPKKYYLCIRLRGTDQGGGAHYATWRGFLTVGNTTQSFTARDNVVANQSLQCSFTMSWNSGVVTFSKASMGLQGLGGSTSLLLGAFDAVELILSMGTVV